MTDLVNNGDKRMTVKEVADAFGVDPEAIKKHVRELFPELMKNGVTTYLNELQVTVIKSRMIPTTEVVAATTELEMLLLDQRVNEWKSRKIAELSKQVDIQKLQIEELKPKAELSDAFMKSESTMSITDCAKYFGLNPRSTVFPYLRDSGYLTLRSLPTQAALDAGYMVLRKTKCSDGEFRPQAMVLDNQLDTWRRRVIPQIKAWETK